MRSVTRDTSLDELAAFVNWTDNPSFDQAVMVARRHPIDWVALSEWAQRESIDAAVIDRLQKHVVGE